MARKRKRAGNPKRNKMRLGSLSKRMLFTWFMLAGLILLFAPQEFTSKFQLAFVRIFRWPLSIGGNFSLAARTQQSLQDVVPRREYDKLQTYRASLEETLIQQQKEFKKLYGLYNEYVWESVDFVLADVITANIEGSRNELTIDCRENVGLVKGHFVLGDESIIGTISDVSSRTASVKLFTDPASNIAVKVAGLKTVMRGNGNNSAKVKMLKRKAKIGEDVFALKEPRFLDAPVVMGRVSRCERNHELPSLWDITVEPACDIEKLEDVAVIIMNQQK